MRFLVTGANGYIGSHLVKRLLEEGHRVVAADLARDHVDARAEYLKADIFTEEAAGFFEKAGEPDVCVHLAWRDGFVHDSFVHLEDLPRHAAFLDGMIRSGLSHLAVMGSMHEIGYWEGAIDESTPAAPLSCYGIAKNALRQTAFLLAERADICLQWIRGYYITGDDRNNHSVFAKILEADAAGQKEFPFTSGNNRYDFMSVEELAEQIAAVVSQTEICGIINCCSGKPMTFAERMEDFIREHALDIRLRYGAYPDRQYDSPGVWGDPSKIQRIMAGIKR